MPINTRIQKRTLYQKIQFHALRTLGGLIVATLIFIILMTMISTFIIEVAAAEYAQTAIIFMMGIIGILSLWLGLSFAYNPISFLEMIEDG